MSTRPKYYSKDPNPVGADFSFVIPAIEPDFRSDDGIREHWPLKAAVEALNLYDMKPCIDPACYLVSAMRTTYSLPC